MILTNRLSTGFSAEYINAAQRIDEKEKSIVHYITTSEKNRMNQVINPDGMDESKYKNNPVVLWMHGSILANTQDDLPIARSAWRQREGNGITAKTIFSDLPLSRDIFYLNMEGFLNAWSIGFMPINGVRKDQNENTIYIDNWELLEYSSVAIPANASALNNMFEVIKTDELKNSLTEMFAVEIFKTEIEEIKNKFAAANGISAEEFGKMKNDFISIERYENDVRLAKEKMLEVINSLNQITKIVNKLNLKNI
jgi:phage head maturation protease